MRLQFIEPETEEFDAKKRQPASYLRRSFTVEKKVAQAELTMTALGCFIGYLNGKRLDEEQLLPGYTDYKYRVQAFTYDVTQQLRQGENVIGALVGDGWYRGALGIGSKRNGYGTRIKLACLLTLQYEDGTGEQITTDSLWQASQEGPLRENDLKVIEHYDAAREELFAGWAEPGYDKTGQECARGGQKFAEAGQERAGTADRDTQRPGPLWHGVRPAHYQGQVIPREGEPVLEQEEFSPRVLHTPDGGTVLDFGQNLSGHVVFRVTGHKGDRVVLTMGECLDENGNFTLKNLAAEGASVISGELGQQLIYELKEGAQEYRSLFQICGFRYCRLENWPGEVRPDDFKAAAVYSRIPMTGEFTCSNPLVNKLVENVRWSQKSNFVDIPTDCPTRERSGWTADISVFSETACYLSDPRRFLAKWLKDYMLEQEEDGSLPYVVPQAGYHRMQRSCMAWSDAIANLSITMYRFYGEKQLLSEVYEAVRRFVDYCERRARKKNPLLFYKTGKHRRYIIETGFHYGEWLEPGTAMYKDFLKDIFLPDTEVTTAWFYQTTSQLVQMAQILGHREDAARYEELAEKIKAAYHKEFLKNGTVSSERCCRYVHPLAQKLVEGDQAKQIAALLDQKCRENQYRIGTGFLSTWQVLPILTRYGYAETAYRMLENTQQPGWLYAVTKGATTTWENWFGMDENNVPVDSHNHYAPGSVVSWLFAYCAGIRPAAPGFEKILIAPVPGGTFTRARASYSSIKGLIRSEWEIKAEKFILETETPEGIPCEIRMPDGTKYFTDGGRGRYICPNWL